MKIFFLVITVVIFSCARHRNKNANFELVIEQSSSYKYDLQKEIYTIFYMDKKQEEIKFQLSKDEKRKIYDKYYELDLNRLPENIYIEGSCVIYPQTFTTLFIIRNNFLQKIQIETGCNQFNIFKITRAKKINNFINYVFKILKSKPEIRNSYRSNIHYL